MKALRKRFWLLACNALDRVGLFGTRAWDFCIMRAAACVEYEPIENVDSEEEW